MKRHPKLIFFVTILSVTLFAFSIKSSPKTDPGKQQLLIDLLQYVITNSHFDPKKVDDNFSKNFYDEYLNSLDPEKKYFLQSDIDEFSSYEYSLDDAVKSKDLTFFNLTYDRFVKRIQDRKEGYAELLSKPFDFFTNESINIDYEKQGYVSDYNEMQNKWRKIFKLDVLSNLTLKLKENEELKTKKHNSKDTVSVKSFVQLEKEVRNKIKKDLDESFAENGVFTIDDAFSIYLNTFVEQFDPHTSYFAPEQKEDFDASISGKFYGIGARLMKKGEYVEVSELVFGGPAWKEKELEAGDIIMKVAQGAKEPDDISGLRLDKVVKKIKGPKGTEVRLTVKKSLDGTIKVIRIVRDEVEMEETYAKSSIVKKDGKTYGIISLPKFYIDFETKDGRDAAKDVAMEVERLKQQGVQGIALDLRNNGGGSLKTVVDIAGLFINEGPIVQVKTMGRNKEVHTDNDPKIQWDGPLVLMVNNLSASASEILAAAMQDYKRGIVLGSKQTYGKGTVQKVVNLNELVRGSTYGDLGALKTTIQKFYRIDGGSTQLKGVESDIVIPDKYTYLEIGERDNKSAMPWDKVEPANYNISKKYNNFQSIIDKSKNRIASNLQLKLIDENARMIKKRRDNLEFSLNLNKFKEDEEKLDQELKKFKALNNYNNQLVFNSLPGELELFKQDVALKEKRKFWHEQLTKDVYIEEAINILSDLQPNVVAKAKVSNKAKALDK